MATSMGPNFQGHPAGMGHPGVSGHPMGPGMNANGGQPGTPGGGMPHQFAGNPMGAGNPAGMNPAMMAAMQHGGNHNMQAAFQHLNPAQQQALQQQQLQNQFSNQPMAQMRQQQLLAQQQRQALMAQQAMAQNGGMAPNNMGANGMAANGMPIGMQLTPQQVQQLRQGGQIGPMQHSQHALMARQMAMQQQHAAAQNQMQQGGPNAQQMQMNAQVLQHLQQQQAQQHQGGPNAQVQMAGQQGQQQGQQGQQNQQGQQPGQQGQQPQGQGQPGQQQQQAHAQAQAQAQAQALAQAQAQQQAHQQAQQQAAGQAQQRQQTPAQGSQAGTPAPTGQHTPQQTPAPGPNAPQPPHTQPHQNPGQPPQQGQQQQQQPGHPPQQQLGHPPQQQPQPQQHPMMAQQMSAIAAQQMAMNNSIMQQRIKAQCLMRLSQLSEQLSGYPGARSRDDLSYWNELVGRFFSRAANFRHTLHANAEGEDTGPRQYDITFPAIARYFHTHFGSGVKSMQLILGQGTIDRPIAGDSYLIENPKASLIYWFETGSHLVSSGSLRVLFDNEQKMEVFEFLATSHEEFIARKQVINAAKPAHNWMKEWHKVNSTDTKQSPEMSKKGKGKQLKSPQREPPEVLNDLPDSAVNGRGVTEAVYQFLEINEVMGQMNPLFNFTHNNPGLGPYSALDQYVTTFINGAPGQMNGQGPQGVPRAPSFSQFPMGASPAAANMNLPGSPHIGSPAPGQIQAPGMQLQQSQQGTSSSGPSANTSPASNKRRRPSAVKIEEDGSAAGTPGSQVNGTGNRNKPATPRMPKRVKANPS